jgi:hypothetical protein
MTKEQLKKELDKRYKDGMLFICVYDDDDYAFYYKNEVKINKAGNAYINVAGGTYYLYDRYTGEFAERYTKVITKVLLTEKS